MASAKIIPVPPVIQPRPRVVLDLSAEEADAVFTVLCHVGGHPDSTPRRFTQAVHDALLGIGAEHVGTVRAVGREAIHFVNPKNTEAF